MADIRLNLIADLSAFQGALRAAVSEAKGTNPVVSVSMTVDKREWEASVRAAKTRLGQLLKTYTTNLEVQLTRGAEARLRTINEQLAGIAAFGTLRPTVDLSELEALNQELTQKQRHLREVAADFKSNKITPVIDTSGLQSLNRFLDNTKANVRKTAQVANVVPQLSRGEQIADLFGKGKSQGGLNKPALEAIAKQLGVSGGTSDELRRNLQETFRNAGEDSIAGLEQGLKDIIRVGGKAADEFSQGFKDFLDISSPSGLFRKFGQFCVEGLANGLLRIDAAAKNAARDFGISFESQLDREIESVSIERQANQLGQRFGDAFGDSVRIAIRGAIDGALATAMVKGGLAGLFGGGKAALGALPGAAGETGGIVAKTAGLIGQLIKDAFLAGPEELGHNLISNVQGIVAGDSGSIASALGKLTNAFISGALDAGIEAIRSNPQAIGQGAAAGLLAGGGAIILKRVVPGLYNALANAIARKAAADVQFAIQAIRNPQQAFAGIQLAFGQVQLSIAYLAQGERKLAGNIRQFVGVSIQFGQSTYQLSRELGGAAGGLLKGVAGFLRSTGLVVAALRGGQVGLLGAAQALAVLEGVRRQQIPPGNVYEDKRLLAPAAGGFGGNDFAMAFGRAMVEMAQGLHNFAGGGGGGRKPPLALPYGEDPNQYDRPLTNQIRYSRRYGYNSEAADRAGQAFSALGMSGTSFQKTADLAEQNRALNTLRTAYRNGVVSASDFARAQIKVQMATVASLVPFKGLIAAVGDLGRQIGSSVKDVLLYGAAFQGLFALQQLPRNIYEAVKAQESFSNTLKASLGAGDTYGQQLQFLIDLSAKYGMNFAQTRQGMVKMFSSMRQANIATQDINSLQESIAVVGTAFKLSTEQVDRVTYALGQMASKGQLTSEELKGQLGDVLPGALAQFAEAAGFKGKDAIAKFSKAMEDGAYKGKALEAVLRNWAIVVQRDFGEAAQQAQGSLQGLENRFANATTRVYEGFSSNLGQILPGVINPLLGGLGNIADALDYSFGNSKKRIEQLKDNLKQLQDAKSTGVAQSTNLELGFRKGSAVDTAQVDQQIQATNNELDVLQKRVESVNANKAAIEIANFARSVRDAFTAISTALSPALQVLGGALRVAYDGLKLILGVINSIPQPVATAAASFYAFAKAIAILQAVGGLSGGLKTLTGTVGALGGVLPAATLAARTFWIAVIGPVGATTAVVAGIAAIGVALYQNNRDFRDWVNAVVQVVQGDFVNAIEVGKRAIGGLRDYIYGRLTAIRSDFISIFESIPEAIRRPFGQLASGISGELQKVTDALFGWYNNLPNWAKSAIVSVAGGTVGGFTGAVVAGATSSVASRAQQQVSANRYTAIGTTISSLYGQNNSLINPFRRSVLRPAEVTTLTPAPVTTSSDSGKGKGKGTGSTPASIQPQFGQTLQDFISATAKAQIEQSRLRLESDIQRLFPSGAGIFQPFVDAFKGVFDFLIQYQERKLSDQESAVRNDIKQMRIDDKSNRAGSRPIAGGFRGAMGSTGRSTGPHFHLQNRDKQALLADAMAEVQSLFSQGAASIYLGRSGATIGRGASQDIITALLRSEMSAHNGSIDLQGNSGAGLGLAPNGKPFLTGNVLTGWADGGALGWFGQTQRGTQIGHLGGRVSVAGATAGTASPAVLQPGQSAQLQQQAAAAQQARTVATGEFIRSGMQNVLGLIRDTSVSDPLSKVSKSLFDMRRQVEDFGQRAREAFINILPEGLRESQRAILDAARGVVEAKRAAEDFQRTFDEALQNGSGVRQLFAGGTSALTDPKNAEAIRKLNEALKPTGKTISDIWKEANGNADEALRILTSLSGEAKVYGEQLLTAALAQERIAKASAPLIAQAAMLQAQQRVQQAMGIDTPALNGRLNQIQIQQELIRAQESLRTSPENAGAIQQQIDALRQLQALNQEFAGTTVGEMLGQVRGGFQGLFSDVISGFDQAAQAGTSFWDAIRGAMANFFNSLGKYLLDLAAQQTANGILSMIGNVFGMGGGSQTLGFFGGASFGNGGGLIPSGSSFGGLNTAGAIFSAVAPGAFALPGFATGGIVSQPTLGLVGEGRYNEAVIPLPDGRSVPVQLSGGAGSGVQIGSVNISVQNSGETLSVEAQRQIANQARAIAVEEIVRQTRSGGVLRQGAYR